MGKEGKGKWGVGKEGKERGKERKRRRERDGGKGDGVLLSGGIDAPGCPNIQGRGRPQTAVRLVRKRVICISSA